MTEPTQSDPAVATDANPPTAAKQHILRLIRCYGNARGAEVGADWRDNREAFERHGATAKEAWAQIEEEIDGLLVTAGIVSIRDAFEAGFAIGVERGHDTAIVPADVTEDTVREDRAVCDRALKEHMVGLAERREAATGWRTAPPALDEVKAGAAWWWHRQRGEDGYTAPSAVQIGWDEDGLFFVEPGCPRVTPEEYGDGAEWHLCPPPTTTGGTP